MKDPTELTNEELISLFESAILDESDEGTEAYERRRAEIRRRLTPRLPVDVCEIDPVECVPKDCGHTDCERHEMWSEFAKTILGVDYPAPEPTGDVTELLTQLRMHMEMIIGEVTVDVEIARKLISSIRQAFAALQTDRDQALRERDALVEPLVEALESDVKENCPMDFEESATCLKGDCLEYKACKLITNARAVLGDTTEEK